MHVRACEWEPAAAYAGADVQDADVKGAASEIEDQDAAIILLLEGEAEGGGLGLPQQPHL